MGVLPALAARMIETGFVSALRRLRIRGNIVRRLRILAVVLAVVLLASCSGGMNCTRVIGIGSGQAMCSGSVDSLNGRRLLTFDLEDVALGVSIDARINVSVASGIVNVAYRNGDGQKVVYAVSPSAPLTVQDVLRLVFIDEAEITLETAGGVASGILYSAEFTR